MAMSILRILHGPMAKRVCQMSRVRMTLLSLPRRKGGEPRVLNLSVDGSLNVDSSHGGGQDSPPPT